MNKVLFVSHLLLHVVTDSFYPPQKNAAADEPPRVQAHLENNTLVTGEQMENKLNVYNQHVGFMSSEMLKVILSWKTRKVI